MANWLKDLFTGKAYSEKEEPKVRVVSNTEWLAQSLRELDSQIKQNVSKLNENLDKLGKHIGNRVISIDANLETNEIDIKLANNLKYSISQTRAEFLLENLASLEKKGEEDDRGGDEMEEQLLAESFINGNIGYVREQIGGSLKKFNGVLKILEEINPGSVESFRRNMTANLENKQIKAKYGVEELQRQELLKYPDLLEEVLKHPEEWGDSTVEMALDVAKEKIDENIIGDVPRIPEELKKEKIDENIIGDVPRIPKGLGDKKESSLRVEAGVVEKGDTQQEDLEKEYMGHIEITSDFVLAEKLTEARLKERQATFEQWHSEFPKVYKHVKKSRKDAEKELYDLIKNHLIINPPEEKEVKIEVKENKKLRTEPTDKDLYSVKNQTKKKADLSNNRIDIVVIFEDGDKITTGFNGTLEDAKKYYEGKIFNLGSGENDKMVKALDVKQIAGDKEEEKK